MQSFSASAAGSVALAWNPSSSTNVAGYKIYYGVACSVYTNAISVGNSTNATVTGLVEGATYYFAATAVDALGVESPFSNETSYSVPVGSAPASPTLIANCAPATSTTTQTQSPGAVMASPPPASPALIARKAPAVLTPPQTQTAEVGSVVTLTASVTGNPSPTFQWYFNGTAIAGTTNLLRLSGIQAANVGAYTLVIRNAYGAVTSTPALLNIVAPVQRRPVPAINLVAQPGSSLGVDYSDVPGSTTGWKSMAAMTASNSSQFCFDVSTPLPPQRYYRAWQSGTAHAAPALSMNFVPAITLTGSVGSKLRLDSINQVGPTNAWATLGTVTLTNTSQLYFDVGVLGQPARLYRITPVP
jgi:hypothetical protein